MTTIIGAPAKNCQGGGGGQDQKYPPPLPKTYGERDPPHGENGLYMERKDCPHRKNTPKGATPPHMEFFYSCSPPGRVLTRSPLACADHDLIDLHSLYSVCLRELGKNQQKLNKYKFFLALSLNFFGGRCRDRIKYSYFHLSIAFH